jgi:hypothetical protein
MSAHKLVPRPSSQYAEWQKPYLSTLRSLFVHSTVYIYLHCCQMVICLASLVSPEHGLFVFQLDLPQFLEIFVPQHFLSLNPGIRVFKKLFIPDVTTK